MGVGAFTDKTHQPTETEMLAALGPRADAWAEVVRCLREDYRAAADVRFYGKSYGWALRFRKRGKALVSLYPGEGGFTAQIIVSEAQIAQALATGMGESVRRAIAAANPYPEGRWLFIRVDSSADLADLRRLLALKAGAGPESPA